jgi:flagellar protein FlbD
MIVLTRLNNRRIVVNAEQIKTIEETPDTLITLMNGDHLIVREPMTEIVRLAIDYARQLHTFRPVATEPEAVS